ncbi:hypothetical protein D3C83_63790 [compost metagenome]
MPPPPEAQVLITSQPASMFLRASFRSSHGPSPLVKPQRYIARGWIKSRCEPVIVVKAPITMRGPSTMPASIASRTAQSSFTSRP